MLRDRYELQGELEASFYEIGRSNAKFAAVRDALAQNYNLPVSIISDIISIRKSLSSFNELINFWITKEIKPELIPKYFTKKEINDFDSRQYEDARPVFPLKLNMTQVAIDQWIGTIKISDLMRLRDNGLLRYNADTQRALKVMERGKEITYKPYISHTAVTKIYQLVKEGSFIPNTITLNISPDDEIAELDCENGVMTIEKVTNFDIVDGYHRLKAYERVYDEDNNFDMMIEVRIISFPVEKAKQFIYQEDQKTKMGRVDSASYNQKDECNQLLEDINKSSDIPELTGRINNKEGLVRLGVASKALSKVLPKKKWTSFQKIKYRRAIVNRLKLAIKENPDLADKRWTNEQTNNIFGSVLAIQIQEEGGGER